MKPHTTPQSHACCSACSIVSSGNHDSLSRLLLSRLSCITGDAELMGALLALQPVQSRFDTLKLRNSLPHFKHFLVGRSFIGHMTL